MGDGLIKDLTGQKLGRWLVGEYAGRNTRGKALWACVCDCGKTAVVAGSHLTSGGSTSCGCKRDERALAASLIHGHSAGGTTRTYHSWRSAKARCFNVNSPNYSTYGGRGISMCDEWRDNFLAFLRDMGERLEGTSLDRFPNNGGNYEPGNCRWATPKEQRANRRSQDPPRGWTRMDVVKQLAGCTFGRLAVTGRALNAAGERTAWHCQCTCGNAVVVRRDSLLSGRTLSCGCLRNEQAGKAHFKKQDPPGMAS